MTKCKFDGQLLNGIKHGFGICEWPDGKKINIFSYVKEALNMKVIGNMGNFMEMVNLFIRINHFMMVNGLMELLKVLVSINNLMALYILIFL